MQSTGRQHTLLQMQGRVALPQTLPAARQVRNISACRMLALLASTSPLPAPGQPVPASHKPYPCRRPCAAGVCVSTAYSTPNTATRRYAALLCVPRCIHSYKVHVWVDAAREAVRIDFRDGVDKTYFIGVRPCTLPPRMSTTVWQRGSAGPSSCNVQYAHSCLRQPPTKPATRGLPSPPLLPVGSAAAQHEEYSVTPHVHDLACKKYEHGGGPIKRPGSNNMPVGMLGKQVGAAHPTEAPAGRPTEQPPHMRQTRLSVDGVALACPCVRPSRAGSCAEEALLHVHLHTQVHGLCGRRCCPTCLPGLTWGLPRWTTRPRACTSSKPWPGRRSTPTPSTSARYG